MISSPERIQSLAQIGLVFLIFSIGQPWLQRRAPTPELAQLQRLSEALAERRRTERRVWLEESAHSGTDSDLVLAALDGLRWLDTVGYHTWRAIHYLVGLQETENGDEIRSELQVEPPVA